MMWFHIVFGVICVISPIVQGAAVGNSGAIDIQIINKNVTGAGLIYHTKKKAVICSGIFHKPMTFLTASNCVLDEDKDDLLVIANVYDPSIMIIDTKVIAIEDMLFFPRKENNNTACIVLLADPNYKVNEFEVLERYMSAENVSEKNTFAYIWNETEPRVYEVTEVKADVQLDHEICGNLVKDPENWYCTVKDKSVPKHTLVDIGTPFFYRENEKKIAVGLYTGLNLDAKYTGYLYAAIYKKPC